MTGKDLPEMIVVAAEQHHGLVVDQVLQLRCLGERRRSDGVRHGLLRVDPLRDERHDAPGAWRADVALSGSWWGAGRGDGEQPL